MNEENEIEQGMTLCQKIIGNSWGGCGTIPILLIVLALFYFIVSSVPIGTH